MKIRGKRVIGLFWIMLCYQMFFLFLIFISVNTGLILFLEKQIIQITADEMKKRNHLLQLTLEETFRSDHSLPPQVSAPDGTDELFSRSPNFPPERNGQSPAATPDSPELPSPGEMPDQDMIIKILVDRIIKVSKLTSTRYTVIGPDGTARFDSRFSPEQVGDIGYQPEIKELLEDSSRDSAVAVRKSKMTGNKTIFQALPLYREGELIGITRVSQPYELTRNVHRQIMKTIRMTMDIALLVILLILIPIIKYMTRLLSSIDHTAREIARGNFNNPRPATRTREFAQLVESIDHMAKQLERQIETIEEQNAKLKEQSRIDELTQLGNRRLFNQRLDFFWWLCLREKHPLSFMILDIDKFKQYNDSLGHPAGDECLKEVSRVLKESIHRHTDILVRLGGEEFGVLLPETDREHALNLGQIILEHISEAAIPHPDSPVAPHVTLSIGLSTIQPAPGIKMEELMDRADRALYRAKEGGRNRLEFE